MGAIERFWICPQYENLRRMRQEPERFFPGDKPPYFCSECIGPAIPEMRTRCCVIYATEKDIKTKLQRQRLARKINRALRKRKNIMNAEMKAASRFWQEALGKDGSK